MIEFKDSYWNPCTQSFIGRKEETMKSYKILMDAVKLTGASEAGMIQDIELHPGWFLTALKVLEDTGDLCLAVSTWQTALAYEEKQDQ